GVMRQDGVRVNQACGSLVSGFLEPRNARLVSVGRGANALSASATTLGGELDFQSRTGTDGDVLRVEGGSFGRLGAQAAKGFRRGSLDGRLSVTHDTYDGYRHHAGSDRTGMHGTFRIQGDGAQNRTH